MGIKKMRLMPNCLKPMYGILTFPSPAVINRILVRANLVHRLTEVSLDRSGDARREPKLAILNAAQVLASYMETDFDIASDLVHSRFNRYNARDRQVIRIVGEENITDVPGKLDGRGRPISSTIVVRDEKVVGTVCAAVNLIILLKELDPFFRKRVESFGQWKLEALICTAVSILQKPEHNELSPSPQIISKKLIADIMGGSFNLRFVNNVD